MSKKQSLFELRDKFSKLNVKEVGTGHATFIEESKVDKIFNSIAKIETNDGTGTGFFIKLKIKNNQLPFLLTCYHVISENDVKSKETIKIYYGKKQEEKQKEIKLDKNNRIINCFPDPIDITLIEIIPKDFIPNDKYLIPNYNYKKNSSFNCYLNKDFYLAGYPLEYNPNGERAVCSGKITQINNYEFSHTLDTQGGSSGSPICLIDDTSVIGIHKGGLKKLEINYGTFIGYIINELENKENIQQIKIAPKLIKLEQYEKMMKNDCMIRLGKLLSKAEIYAFKFGKNIIISKSELAFSYYYDKYDYLLNKSTRMNLFEALKNEFELFNTDLKEYFKSHKTLKIDNLSKTNLLEHINKLISCLSEDTEKIVYNNIFIILEKNYDS